jgi:hypothetical protein
MACRAPEAVGLNGLILDGLKNHLGSLAGANIHSVLVVHRGTLVYEQYFVDEDQCFGESTWLHRVLFGHET